MCQRVYIRVARRRCALTAACLALLRTTLTTSAPHVEQLVDQPLRNGAAVAALLDEAGEVGALVPSGGSRDEMISVLEVSFMCAECHELTLTYTSVPVRVWGKKQPSKLLSSVR